MYIELPRTISYRESCKGTHFECKRMVGEQRLELESCGEGDKGRDIQCEGCVAAEWGRSGGLLGPVKGGVDAF